MKTQQNNAQQNTAPETLGERIKELRKKRKMSLEGVAETFTLDKSTWSRYESGAHSVPNEIVQAICEKWHVSADYLLFGENKTENLLDLNGFLPSQIHAIKAMVDSFRHS